MRWLLAIVILLLLALTLWQFDGETLLHSFGEVPLWLMFFLIFLQIISQLLINFLWYNIANLTGMTISFSKMLYVNCQGAVMDAITPGVKFGGEVTRAVQISRATGCSKEQAASVVALQKVFSLSSLFVVLVFTVGFIDYAVFVFAALPLLIALLVWRFRKQLALIRKRNWLSLLALSFLIWLMYPLKLYLLTRQFADVSVFSVGSAGFAAYMVAMLPIFPGGLGGFEGTLSGLLVHLGFELNNAVAATILFRFVTFWAVMLGSLIYIGLKRGWLRE